MKRTARTRLLRYGLYSLKVLLLTGMLAWFVERSLPVTYSAPASPTLAAVGHRGASGYAPESTMAAYQLAVRMNVDYIELDLQMTRDGHIVIMHDETVDRTTDGHGAIKGMTLAKLKSLDAGSWFNSAHPEYARPEYAGERVPTLREIFQEFGEETMYLLETKSPADYPGLEEKAWSLIKEFKLQHRVAFQSFSKKSLQKLRKRSPNVLLFQLIWYNHPSTITRSKINDIKRYANGIGANFGNVNEEYARKVKEAGLLFYPYTINYESNMDVALQWGVDGIHTDYPDRFKALIEQYRKIEASLAAS